MPAQRVEGFGSQLMVEKRGMRYGTCRRPSQLGRSGFLPTHQTLFTPVQGNGHLDGAQVMAVPVSMSALMGGALGLRNRQSNRAELESSSWISTMRNSCGYVAIRVSNVPLTGVTLGPRYVPVPSQTSSKIRTIQALYSSEFSLTASTKAPTAVRRSACFQRALKWSGRNSQSESPVPTP